MMLFLAYYLLLVHGQWKDLKDRAKSRSNTEDCLPQWSSWLTLFFLLLICLRNSINEFKARLQAAYFFSFADSITLFKKLIRKKVSYLHPDRRNLSIDEPTSFHFFLFQKSFNAQDVLEFYDT